MAVRVSVAVLLLAALLATAPLLVHGSSCGHDFDFHLASWLDAQNAWRHGLFYPHWAPSANFGAGEARFVFYPPLTWMLGAALGMVLPWTLVPAALTFLLLAGAGLATRTLARLTQTEAPSALAGCLAVFSGYTLFTAYERTAYGELCGGIWIPLLLLFALRDDRFEAEPAAGSLRAAHSRSALALALVVAGAWLSNAPLGVMASYLLAFVALCSALLCRSWQPILRAAAAMALGLSLSAFFLIPAAYEQRWVNISQATDDPGERIENSFLFGHHADPALALHDVELHRVSLLAVSMLAAALVGLVIAWRRGRLSEQRRWGLPLALIPLAILLLQLPLSLPVWNLLPKLRFLQFPWRWLVALEAPMGIFLAAAVWPGERARRWARPAIALGFALLFVVATVYAARNFFQACDDEDAVTGMLSVYRAGAGFVGTDEYAPLGADSALAASGLPGACLASDPTTPLGLAPVGDVPAAAGDDVPAPVWTVAQGSCEETLQMTGHSAEHLSVRGTAARSGYLILRLRSFPAWKTSLNGRLVTPLATRPDGLIALPVQAGEVDLRIDWTATPDVLLGRWIGGLGALLFTAMCASQWHRSRARLS
jgi:hypothetical protein